MAGGYHLFSSGEVLTAANANNYLMNQTTMVFASAAARTSALAGVLAEGMVSYRTDSHILEYYTGSAWTSVAPTVWTTSAIAANTTLVARTQYMVTTSSAWTLTLPASPAQGDEIRIFDVSGSAATNNITVSPNGLNFQGSVQNGVMATNYGSTTLIYTGSTYGWKAA